MVLDESKLDNPCLVSDQITTMSVGRGSRPNGFRLRPSRVKKEEIIGIDTS